MSVVSPAPVRPPRWPWRPPFPPPTGLQVIDGRSSTPVVLGRPGRWPGAQPLWHRFAARRLRGDTLLGSWVLAIVGHVVVGAGVALMLGADLGLVGWSVLHAGIAGLSGTSVGNAAVATAVLCLAVGVLTGWRPTTMVIIAAVVGAVLVDVVGGVLPVVHGLWRWCMVLSGALVVGTGTGVYLGAGVGACAHDVPFALLRRSGLSVGTAALTVTVATTVLGLVLGGPVGPASPAIAAVMTGVVPRMVRRVEAHVRAWASSAGPTSPRPGGPPTA